MDKQELKKLIDTAAGRIPADLVIKNCKVVNVFSGEIISGDIAVSGSKIAGIGEYEGREVVDAKGSYAVPGLIDSHIHIESSYVTPEEIGRLLVPHGTTTIIADPHEIVNVCGIRGLDYMMEAAERTALDIQYVVPSCVPATPFEHAGAVIGAAEMEEPIQREEILGLGEFMNFPGVIGADDSVLEKLLVAKRAGKVIDGHGPGISGKELNAYAAARILADHECSTVEEMNDRLARGMYILLRQGSACHNLRTLLRGVTGQNSRRCLLCSDDRQPKTILQEGHLDNHLRICREEGIDAITAIRMATLNAAECFGLREKGAIAPGYQADIVLMKNLEQFETEKVWIGGKLTAEDGRYLPETSYADIAPVRGSVIVKDFSKEKLKMHLKSNRVNVIEIQPGGVVTKKTVEEIKVDENGEFIRDPQKDLVKIAVVERHQGTGNVACGFLKGYGIKEGAVALSVAHDSHNIIAVGVSDEEITFAVESLIKQEGGIVLVKEGKIIEEMPMPIAGLMSDRSGEWVDQKLTEIHEKAYAELGICGEVEPVMTLCFMSLAVIPELKLTDMGLFDVTTFQFISVEAE
ncbi:MAG: adenine deaminase [Lachnospiraceae bacterium]|nr:adenine deaminase [Lachnospiraceae bacterium]